MRIKINLIFLILFLSFILKGSAQDSVLMQELTSAIKQVEEGNYNESFLLFDKIIKQAQKINDQEVVIRTKLNKGLMYYRVNDKEKSLNMYYECIDLAKHIGRMDLLTSVYNNIGIVYSTNNDYEQSTVYFKKALELNKQKQDTFKMGINLINIATNCINLKEYALALEYISETERVFENSPNHQYLAATYSAKGQVLYDQEKYILAKQSILKAQKIGKLLGDPMYLEVYDIQLGKVYLKLNINDSAIYYLNKGIEFARQYRNFETLSEATQLLAEIYKNQNNLNRAFEYFDESLSWRDSLLNDRKQKWVSEIQMKYDFEKKTTEIELLEKRNQLNVIIWLLAFSVLLIISVLLIVIMRNRVIRTKQENELKELNVQKTEAENRCLLEEMKANEEVNQIKQQNLQEKLELKERELASNALHIVNKNSILSDIKEKLNEILFDQKLMTSKQIKDVVRLVDSNISLDDDWETFKMHFEQVHGNFFNRLQENYPNLTQGDLRLCAYHVINLNPKEIAKILNITPDSIRKRKQRLREKLELDKNVDVVDFLVSYKN